MRGYSQIVVETNQKATESLGVQLGALCINLKYPVQKVAERLNISRQTVYDWFSGRANPTKKKRDGVNKLIIALTQNK